MGTVNPNCNARSHQADCVPPARLGLPVLCLLFCEDPVLLCTVCCSVRTLYCFVLFVCCVLLLLAFLGLLGSLHASRRPYSFTAQSQVAVQQPGSHRWCPSHITCLKPQNPSPDTISFQPGHHHQHPVSSYGQCSPRAASGQDCSLHALLSFSPLHLRNRR